VHYDTRKRVLHVRNDDRELTIDIAALLHETASLDMGKMEGFRAPIVRGRYGGVSGRMNVFGTYTTKCRNRETIENTSLIDLLTERQMLNNEHDDNERRKHRKRLEEHDAQRQRTCDPEDEVEVTGERTWEQRDQECRRRAVDLETD
jgi:hypothetical protein